MMIRTVLFLFLFAFPEINGLEVIGPDNDHHPSSGSTSSTTYPSCFKEDTTWSTTDTTMISGVQDAYSCQSLCQESATCHHFTWYNEQAFPLILSCFLYDQPTEEYPCSNCVSGPQSCTCSAFFNCQPTQENFVGQVPHVETESLCQDHCFKTTNCTFYSWLDQDNDGFPNLCLLFSSCQDKFFNCIGCHSGPVACDDISAMTTSTPPPATTTSPYFSCFDEDTTWHSNEITSTFPNIFNPSQCQDLCQNNSDICSDFTFYTDDAAPENMCMLFQDPSTPIPCTHCLSGPLKCTCGAEFACEVDNDNVIDFIPSIVNEILCQEQCFQSLECRFYTYYSISSHPFQQTCFLFSSCDEVDFSCEGCSSGPDDCRNISYISTSLPTTPPTTTTLPPTTSTIPATTTLPPTTSTTITTTTTSDCPVPDPPKHGDWFCPHSTEVPTCHLECDPGYASTNYTVITCHHGEWSSAPSCVPAVALITGSWNSPRTVEVYSEGLHLLLPNLPDHRSYHSLDLVDSSVLLCGGYDTKTSCLMMTSSQQWVPHSTTSSPRYRHSSVSALGQLHLLGGYDSRSTSEYLARSSTTWSEGWQLLEDSYYACTAKVAPEVAMMTGGGSHSSSVISYNVTSGAATRLQDLSTPTYQHGCCYIRDEGFRGVLVAGGLGGDLDVSQLYDINTGEWSTTGPLTTGRYGVRLFVIGDQILASGGYKLSTVDRFNLTTRTWKSAEGMMQARSWHAVTAVPPSAVGLGSD